MEVWKDSRRERRKEGRKDGKKNGQKEEKGGDDLDFYSRVKDLGSDDPLTVLFRTTEGGAMDLLARVSSRA